MGQRGYWCARLVRRKGRGMRVLWVHYVVQRTAFVLGLYSVVKEGAR